jgi:hypothetical protein
MENPLQLSQPDFSGTAINEVIKNLNTHKQHAKNWLTKVKIVSVYFFI